MKATFTALFLLTFHTVLNAACQLDHPINIGSLDLVDKGIVLKDVVLDVAPRFDDPGKYNATTDKMDLYLFNIEANATRMDLLGARLQVLRSREVLGFSDVYIGNFDGSMSGTRNERGATIHHTKLVTSYTESPHAAGQGINELTVTVRNGQILSIELTAPVYRIWKREGNTHFIAFAGTNQTLCVKSAH